MAIISVRNLTKRFDDFTAVDHINFTVEPGEIFGFLGPNGAGKSTTISMLSTIMAPTEGEAKINGFPVLSERDEVRKSIGLVFQDPSLDEQLKAEENLRFHARLYGISKEEFAKRSKEVLDLVDLWDRRGDLVSEYSGGMKRRLEIARGLIHYPKVLFLDEPTLGLDPQTRSHLWEYILKLKREKGMTIFLTTHYMNEAEYCDRIAIIDHGKIVALDTPKALKASIGGDIITLKAKNLSALEQELMKQSDLKLRKEDGMLYLEVKDGEIFLPKLLKEVKEPVEAVELRKPTLDDVFLSITGRAYRQEEASSKDKMRRRMRMRRPH